MSLAAELWAEAVPACEARGGFGSRIRRMQAVMRRAAEALDLIDEVEVRAALRAAIALTGQGQFARLHGIPQSVVSEVASGRRPVPESIANALGYVEAPKRYRKIAKGAA